MQQTLNFFDTMLSHDHPAYLGILRLAYEAANIANDKALVRLYIVALTFLPINIFTSELIRLSIIRFVSLTYILFLGGFGMNVYLPHNGVFGTPLEPDGSPAPFYAFGGVIAGLALVVSLVMLTVYWIFRDTRQRYEKAGRRRRL